MKSFHITVIGDSGFDYCTVDDQIALSPSAGHAAEIVRPFAAPSGARFAYEAMSSLFAKDTSISVTGVLPRALWGMPRMGFRDNSPSTIPSCHVILDRFPRRIGYESTPSTAGYTFRIRKVTPLDIKSSASTVFAAITAKSPRAPYSAEPLAQMPHVLYIHHGGGAFCAVDTQSRMMEFLNAALSSRDNKLVIVDLANTLPTLAIGSHGPDLDESQPIWSLLKQHASKVCIICSARMLRHRGSALRRHLSWEQTYEDLARELYAFPPLSALARFEHLVVRFGISSVVYVNTPQHTSKRTAVAFFAALARDLVHRDRVEDGEVVGANVLLGASIARSLCDRWQQATPISQPLGGALRTGLRSCIRSYDMGYLIPIDEHIDGLAILKQHFEPLGHLITGGYVQTGIVQPSQLHETIGVAPIPASVLKHPNKATPRTSQSWSILRQALHPHGSSISRLNVGIALTRFGYERILNANESELSDPDIKAQLCRREYADGLDYDACSVEQLRFSVQGDTSVRWRDPTIAPLFVPILRVGQMIVIERNEIESLRAIRNLLRRYVADVPRLSSARQPLSIAVFGPPGSGKSFLVKQIVASVNASLHKAKLQLLERNVAQFRSTEDLEDALTCASGVNNDGAVPVVLFDEFDCRNDLSDLGWLKYFLAPMQDGVFYGKRQAIHFGPAVLFFAGGVNHSFSTFEECSDAHDQSAREQVAKRQISGTNARGRQVTSRAVEKSRAQKVPDFISRLSGHVDILPITRDLEGRKYILRRAIMLREFLRDRKLMIRRGDHEVAGIDEDVLCALLTVDSYRHGVRSMTNILNMCIPIAGQIEKASLPPPAQLNMHVDAEEFFLRMYRSRWRLTGDDRVAEFVLKSSPPHRTASAPRSIDSRRRGTSAASAMAELMRRKKQDSVRVTSSARKSKARSKR